MNPNIANLLRIVRIKLLRIRTLSAKEITVGRRVLVIAPHPDDEVMGCGGLIARLCAQGNPPQVIVLTRGEASHKECCDTPSAEISAARHRLTLDSARILGLPEGNIHCMDFGDGHIADDMQSDKRESLRLLLSEIGPDSIFVPHWGEGWPDHVNAARMVSEIAPSNAGIYEYCVWMWYYNVWRLDWHNAYQLKMTPAEHAKKLAAIDAYVRPCAPCGKPLSGVLPRVFVDANSWNRELYYKAR